jgi:hypothetical protein
LRMLLTEIVAGQFEADSLEHWHARMVAGADAEGERVEVAALITAALDRLMAHVVRIARVRQAPRPPG